MDEWFDLFATIDIHQFVAWSRYQVLIGIPGRIETVIIVLCLGSCLNPVTRVILVKTGEIECA
jgi:hypothetical protein